jgi:hypothetical protein
MLDTIASAQAVEVDFDGYQTALANFVEKYVAARSRLLGPGHLETPTPQFQKEAFDRFVEEHKIAKSTHDLEPGEVSGTPSSSSILQAVTRQESIMPVVPLPEPEPIPLGAEETLFYEDYFPGQHDRSIGTFFDRSVFDENAKV